MNKNNTQTAVEWLLSELSFINSLDDVIDGSAKAILTTAVIKEAKAMEKKQIENAHLSGLLQPLEMEATKQAEQYYNETYGKGIL